MLVLSAESGVQGESGARHLLSFVPARGADLRPAAPPGRAPTARTEPGAAPRAPGPADLAGGSEQRRLPACSLLK